MPDRENDKTNFNAKIKISPAKISRRAGTSGSEFVDLLHASLAQAGQSKDRDSKGKVPKDIRERAQNLDALMTKTLAGDPKMLKKFITNPMGTFEKIAGKQEPEFLRTVKEIRRKAEKQTAPKAAVDILKPESIEITFGSIKRPRRKPTNKSQPHRQRRT